ncbi:transcriptional regulator [Clostridia bacterium]|nr:transcriptional regulator [Clostridia bacterium]
MKLQVSYKKLWHLLIEHNMQRQELRRAAGISSSTIAKIVKNENVNTDILLKICEVLNCNFADIMDAVPIEGDESAEAQTEEQ